MAKKIFVEEKKILQEAAVDQLLPGGEQARIAKRIGTNHSKVSNVANGICYDKDIVRELKASLVSTHHLMGISLKILSKIETQ